MKAERKRFNEIWQREFPDADHNDLRLMLRDERLRDMMRTSLPDAIAEYRKIKAARVALDDLDEVGKPIRDYVAKHGHQPAMVKFGKRKVDVALAYEDVGNEDVEEED